MPDEPLFDFAVPDDLLREAVTQVKDADVVADVAMMPGTAQAIDESRGMNDLPERPQRAMSLSIRNAARAM